MERAAWTDERLDDLAEAIRTGFGRLDQDNRDLRSDLNQGLGGLRKELNEGLGGLRGELNEGMGGLRGEIQALRTEMQHEFSSLRTVMFTFGGGIIVALIGVIAAILARGA